MLCFTVHPCSCRAWQFNLLLQQSTSRQSIDALLCHWRGMLCRAALSRLMFDLRSVHRQLPAPGSAGAVRDVALCTASALLLVAHASGGVAVRSAEVAAPDADAAAGCPQHVVLLKVWSAGEFCNLLAPYTLLKGYHRLKLGVGSSALRPYVLRSPNRGAFSSWPAARAPAT